MFIIADILQVNWKKIIWVVRKSSMVRVTFFLFKTSMETENTNFSLYFLQATCHLLISFANSMVPDQAPQNIGHDLDPNSLKFTHGITEFFLLKMLISRQQMGMPFPSMQKELDSCNF